MTLPMAAGAGGAANTGGADIPVCQPPVAQTLLSAQTSLVAQTLLSAQTSLVAQTLLSAAPVPALSPDLDRALNSWCFYAVALATLDELDLRAAFLCRDDLRRLLAAGAPLPADEGEALRVADEIVDQDAARVLRLLALGNWIATVPADSYAAAFYRRHQPGGPPGGAE